MFNFAFCFVTALLCFNGVYHLKIIKKKKKKSEGPEENTGHGDKRYFVVTFYDRNPTRYENKMNLSVPSTRLGFSSFHDMRLSDLHLWKLE